MGLMAAIDLRVTFTNKGIKLRPVAGVPLIISAIAEILDFRVLNLHCDIFIFNIVHARKF